MSSIAPTKETFQNLFETLPDETKDIILQKCNPRQTSLVCHNFRKINNAVLRNFLYQNYKTDFNPEMDDKTILEKVKSIYRTVTQEKEIIGKREINRLPNEVKNQYSDLIKATENLSFYDKLKKEDLWMEDFNLVELFKILSSMTAWNFNLIPGFHALLQNYQTNIQNLPLEQQAAQIRTFFEDNLENLAQIRRINPLNFHLINGTLQIDPNLLTRLPEEIKNFINLEEIYLGNSYIRQVNKIKDLAHLKKLDLSTNELTELPEGYQTLPKSLQKIELKYNHLDKATPRSIKEAIGNKDLKVNLTGNFLYELLTEPLLTCFNLISDKQIKKDIQNFSQATTAAKARLVFRKILNFILGGFISGAILQFPHFLTPVPVVSLITLGVSLSLAWKVCSLPNAVLWRSNQTHTVIKIIAVAGTIAAFWFLFTPALAFTAKYSVQILTPLFGNLSVSPLGSIGWYITALFISHLFGRAVKHFID